MKSYINKILLLSVLIILTISTFYSCNENLGQPPGEEQFNAPGSGPYPAWPWVPYVMSYEEKEPDVSIGLTGIPKGVTGINDFYTYAEKIGLDPDGENVAPEENGSIIAVKGTISGITGLNYKIEGTSVYSELIELRHKKGSLVCTTADGGHSDALNGSPDDYFVVNTGVHFKNRFKTNGFDIELKWNSLNAKMAIFDCNTDTGEWAFRGGSYNYPDVNPIPDRDINLDIYFYRIGKWNDLEILCDTEGWRRHPETCHHSPDILYGPWDHFKLIIRVSLYGDEFEWRYNDNSGDLIYDIPYTFELTIE